MRGTIVMVSQRALVLLAAVSICFERTAAFRAPHVWHRVPASRACARRTTRSSSRVRVMSSPIKTEHAASPSPTFDTARASVLFATIVQSKLPKMLQAEMKDNLVKIIDVVTNAFPAADAVHDAAKGEDSSNKHEALAHEAMRSSNVACKTYFEILRQDYSNVNQHTIPRGKCTAR